MRRKAGSGCLFVLRRFRLVLSSLLSHQRPRKHVSLIHYWERGPSSLNFISPTFLRSLTESGHSRAMGTDS